MDSRHDEILVDRAGQRGIIKIRDRDDKNHGLTESEIQELMGLVCAIFNILPTRWVASTLISQMAAHADAFSAENLTRSSCNCTGCNLNSWIYSKLAEIGVEGTKRLDTYSKSQGNA